MKDNTLEIFESYKNKYEFMAEMETDIIESVQMIIDCYNNAGKLLVCGNGGSNADADHIVGELVKGFVKKRTINESYRKVMERYGAGELAKKLQGGLPAINLGAHTSLITAVINDMDGEAVFAQQVMGYGKTEDILLGISTSGNSVNVINAGIVAKAKGMKSILLTGGTGGKGKEIFDISLIVPDNITANIQDMHTGIYHAICMMVENEFWDL